MLNMIDELERVRRLRRMLEPLAVLFEKVVLKASREPFEVTLRATQGAQYGDSDDYPVRTIHIIDGESLQAAHEIWDRYRQMERSLMGDRLLHQGSGEPLTNTGHEGDDLGSLSEEERDWLEWFFSLPVEDQVFVEDCGEKGISVTLENFDQIRESRDIL